MSARLIHRTCVAVLILGSTLLAQQFSADQTETNHGKTSHRKVYVNKTKMRYEEPENTSILDLDTRKVLVLIPAQHMYIESEITAKDAQTIKMFHSADPEDACTAWQKLAEKPGGSCKKVGHENLNGRDTVKYEGSSPDGDSMTIWIDPKVNYAIKIIGKNSVEMTNIQPGSQPSSLFEVPAGYKKMDMGGMKMPSRN